ncbi:MAG: DUF3098 domain-containing protein [Parafilimonas sp.]
MAEIKKQSPQQKQTVVVNPTSAARKTVAPAPELFNKENYKWMIIGGVIVILGMILMSGGRSQDPNTFDPKVVYSTTRVTIAPILIIGGLLVELFAILRKPKPAANA